MLKTVSDKPIFFVPKSEQEADKPTAVCFKPLSKRQYDEYMDSLTEFKRNKVISKANKAGEKLFRMCLHPDDQEGTHTLESGKKVERVKGALIYNAWYDGKEIPFITDKDIATDYLLGIADIDSANELEQAMKGASTLEEEEEKN